VVLPLALLSATLAFLVWLGTFVNFDWHQSLAARVAGGALASAVVIGAFLLTTRPVGRSWLRGMLKPRLSSLGTGIMLWIVPAGLGLGVLAALGQLHLATPPIPGSIGGWLAVVPLAVLLTEAIPEELVFRGVIAAVLEARWNRWAALAVQTILFTAWATALRGWSGMLDLSLFIAMGLVLGYLRMLTGSVWTAVGFHLAFQTGSQILLAYAAVNSNISVLFFILGALPFGCAVLVLPTLVRLAPTLHAHPR